MASIRKRGDLQWEVRIRRKGHPVTCKTFNTKGYAERWARDVENEMDRGIFVSRTEAENTTLHEALERFIEEYVPRYRHPDTPKYTARSLQRRKISTKFLASIRTKDIADFIRERESEGMSGNTVRLDLALLSRLFNVARSSWGMESLTILSSGLQGQKLVLDGPAALKGMKRKDCWIPALTPFVRSFSLRLKRQCAVAK